jgi:SAM-dependent methyltransferase
MSPQQGDNRLLYDGGSFRDPSGKIFHFQGKIFRELDQESFDKFAVFSKSPVCAELLKERAIVWSKEVDPKGLGVQTDNRVIEHEKIPLISYCYEWSPSMLRDAGLLVLDLQSRLLEHGFSLKDATPYNVQFKDGKPVWIDIASIEPWDRKPAWVAYSQFCRFFLYPLLLARYNGMTLRECLLPNLEGISFEDALKKLPLRAKLNPKFFTDITLPAILGKLINESVSHKIISEQKENPLAKEIQQNTLARLRNLLAGMRLAKESFWSGYEGIKNYNDISEEQKNEFVRAALAEARSKSIIDVGCNTGLYSKIAAEALPEAEVVSTDFDPESIDALYLANKKWGSRILPLVVDATNASPALGWKLKERKSFFERGKFDAALALAVIHHLRVGKNIPLESIAEFFASLAERHLVIEFVHKEDSMWKRLTAIRADTFGDYSQENFERLFSRHFALKRKLALPMGTRTMYFYENILP